MFWGVFLVGIEFGWYFVMEEIERGLFVVNLVKDLGLGDGELVVRRVRVFFDDNK